MPEPTIGEKLRQTTRALSAMLTQSEAAYEARLLLCHVLNLSAEALVLRANDVFPQVSLQTLEQLTQARIKGEPLQYLLGSWGFMGLTFEVGPGVLIPRQDTETLCEEALSLSEKHGLQTALDLCCGSGCIGVALAKLGGLNVTFSDISPDALRYAKCNAQKNGVTATFLCTDLFEGITGTFDLIVCNPPYIPTHELPTLQAEVQREPHLALDGGADGLDFYRRLAKDYSRCLTKGGALLLEVGAGQAKDVAALFEGYTYTLEDICGITRVVVASSEPCGYNTKR